MKWFWFPLAVVATSLVLVAALVAVVAFPARAALASTLGANPLGSGGPWHGGSGFTLPAELQGLASIPPDQRFNHFEGGQINLKDSNGHPLTISVTPGTASAASATSLTMVANDGSTKTFTLDNQTMIHGNRAAGTGQTTQSTIAKGDTVVVMTLNQSTTATAVVDGGPNGFSWPGSRGPWGPMGNQH